VPVVAMAVRIGVKLFVEMPATILRYSARVVGTVPMGRGVLLCSTLGYAKSCIGFGRGALGGVHGGKF